MPWISRRNMTLAGHKVKRGGVISEKVIASIPTLRFNSLVRVGHLAEVDASQLGEECPICGEGPFTRLARHMTAKHDDEILGLEEAVSSAEAQIPPVEVEVSESASEEE